MAMKLGKTIQCNTPYQLKIIQQSKVSTKEKNCSCRITKIVLAKHLKVGRRNKSWYFYSKSNDTRTQCFQVILPNVQLEGRIYKNKHDFCQGNCEI